MGRIDFSDDLEDFVNKVLEPSEALARIFENAYVGVSLNYGETEIKAGFHDVAQVSGALTTLTRFRLQQFVDRLQERVGPVQVKQPFKDIVVDYEVTQVEIEEAQSPGPTPHPDESLESIKSDVEKLKKRTQKVEKENEKRIKELEEIMEENPELWKKQ